MMDIDALDAFGISLDDEAALEAVDYLAGGQEVTYPQLVYFAAAPGKNPIVEYDKRSQEWVETDDQAKGLWCEAAKTPEDLMEAIRELVAGGKARTAFVMHDDGKRKEYWTIPGSEYFVLSHGIPSQWQVMHFDKEAGTWVHNVEKEIGIARGSVTVENKDADTQSTYNFISFLVVIKQLATVYVDDAGNPRPFLMSFKGLNAKVMHEELTAHYSFIVEQRKWYAKELLNNKEFLAKYGKRPDKMRIAKTIADMHCQFWAYSIRIDAAKTRKEHASKKPQPGKQAGSVKVYEPENKCKGLYSNNPSAEEALCASKELTAKLMQFVYDTSKRPAEIGGEAITYCRDRVQKAIDNQNTLNRYGDNEYGNDKKRPAWMAKQSMMASHGMHEEDLTDIPASMRPGNAATPSGAPVRNAQAAAQVNVRLSKLKGMHRIFEANDSQEGQSILFEIEELFKDETLSDVDKAEILEGSLAQAETIVAMLKEQLGDEFLTPAPVKKKF